MKMCFAVKLLKKRDQLGRTRFKITWRDEHGKVFTYTMAGVTKPFIDRFKSLGYTEITNNEMEILNG